MIRKQFKITKEQDELVKREAFENDCSQAEVVRKALEHYFQNQKEVN